jgi:hypothetical protein
MLKRIEEGVRMSVVVRLLRMANREDLFDMLEDIDSGVYPRFLSARGSFGGEKFLLELALFVMTEGACDVRLGLAMKLDDNRKREVMPLVTALVLEDDAAFRAWADAPVMLSSTASMVDV